MLANRVKETTSTTGTGSFTTTGAFTGFQTFNTAFGLNKRFLYWAENSTDNEWETGVGYLSASTTLVRETVLDNHLGTAAAINFTTAPKLFCASNENIINKIQNKNALINGNFDIWQRGTTQSVSGYGSDDRWYNGANGSTLVNSRQAFTVGQTDVLGNPKYYSRTVVTSSAGAGNFVYKSQKIEAVAIFSGETVTLSFEAKADASKNMAIEFYQDFGSGGSAAVSAIGSQLIALTTSWQKFEVTVDIPSISGKTVGTSSNLALLFWFDCGSTYAARSASLGQQNGTFEVSKVKVEEGAIATPFEQRSFDEELVLCQRYYEKSFAIGTPPSATQPNNQRAGYIHNGTDANARSNFKVVKRGIPTITLWDAAPVIGATNLWHFINSSNVWATSTATVANVVDDRGFNGKATGTGIVARDSTLVKGHWEADAEL